MNNRNGDNVQNGLLQQGIIELNTNVSSKKNKNDIIYYEIMHAEKKVAEINTRG